MATVQITRLDETDPAALYCHYAGQHTTQDCYLSLDLKDGEMSADFNSEIGTGVPKPVFDHRTLRFTIPCLTAEAANQLMDALTPLAQEILNGSTVEWDGRNNIGSLNSDARTAQEQMAEKCSPQNDTWGPESKVEEYSAGDWYPAYTNDDGVREDLGITADTTDEELAAMAEREEEEAHNSGNSGYTILTGVQAYLTGLREEVRETVREELEAVAGQITELTEQRNDLVRRLAGWNDSGRAIGALAGLSHTQVQNILTKTSA